EDGVLSGAARDGNSASNGSMGLDAGDFDGSGVPALWVTNYEKEYHGLYRNQCRGDRILFLFWTPTSGIGALGQNFVGWGTGFVDLDHHGWEDLFIANGHAIRYPTGGPTRRQKPVLMRNVNGKFKEISKRGGSYFEQVHLSRGVALGDLNNDGKIDAVISHINEPVSILRNIASEGNHWLGVELHGKGHSDFGGAPLILP